MGSVTTSEANFNFNHEQQVMKMFCDNAKTYIQLSGAALGLTLSFARQILHIPQDQNVVDAWMIAMWGSFLLAVLAGAFYQYLAVKYLESYLETDHYEVWDWLQPGFVYGLMLAFFYSGAVIFTVYAIVRLYGRQSLPTPH